jgi:hypothetical protein
VDRRARRARDRPLSPLGSTAHDRAPSSGRRSEALKVLLRGNPLRAHESKYRVPSTWSLVLRLGPTEGQGIDITERGFRLLMNAAAAQEIHPHDSRPFASIHPPCCLSNRTLRPPWQSCWNGW